MIPEIIIGIDPGIHGGVCALQGNEIVFLERTPKKKVGRKNDCDCKLMSELIEKFKDKKAKIYIEEVHAMPKQGVTSMFNFGKGYGIWIGIAAACKIPIEFVSPRVWKKKLLSHTDKSKEASISAVKTLFPDIDLKPGRLFKDHDGMAEAALIAIYGGTKEWQ